MKLKIIVAFLALCLFAFPVLAEETGGANYSSPNGHANALAEFLNEQDCIGHTHQYNVPERDDPLGVGADLVVYEDDNPEAKLEAVTVEVKRDFQNEETSVFAVVRVNMWKFFSKKDDE